MSEAYDRRDIASLLVGLKQTLKAPRTDATVHKALPLQTSLIAFLLGQISSLQMQVELLTKCNEGK
jgi:hypothetical protein